MADGADIHSEKTESRDLAAPSLSTMASQPWLNVLGSRYFLDWLQEQRVSLAFTTYQTGKLFFVGRKPDGGCPCSSERLITAWDFAPRRQGGRCG